MKKSLPDSLKPSHKTSRGFSCGLARGPISGTDTERNFLSCGIIRKTTESFTGLLQQLKFNNGAADKIVELLVEKPNADVRRFSAAHGENDRSGRVQRGCSEGQMAKKVFLIEWQRGISFNKSAKSFHSLNPHFTEHTQLWQDVEELRAD